MVAHDFYVNELKKSKEIEAEHMGCVEKVKSVLERASDNLKAANDVQQEFDDFAKRYNP